MANKNQLKKFVIRKYIFATSAIEGIKKDRRSPVDDVWIDEDWKKLNSENTSKQIGFHK